MNYGLILPTISPISLEFGGMTTVEDKIIFPDGSLIANLPEYETQANTFMDDFGCVSHSLENGGEAVIDNRLKTYKEDNQKWLLETIYKNGKPNFSDRDLVVLSGTTNQGNSGDKVLAAARDKGLIPQTAGDFDSFSRDTKNTKEFYYAYSRIPEAQKLADEWNKRFEITGEWVVRSKWEEASKRGALQIYVNAWYPDNGVYVNPTGRYNHAVLMADYQGKKIFDTYKPELKELDSWDSAYVWALKINITEKNMIKPVIKNNTLIQLVEGGGDFGLYLDGKIIVDSLDKILASWLVRTGGNTNGMTKALTLEQWNMFDKYDLRMNKIN